MGKIEKIRDDLYIKKSFDGYSVVHPIKKDLEKPLTFKNLHWFNFLTGGNYWKLVKLIVILLMIFGLTWSYVRDIRVCRDIAEYAVTHPCEWCSRMSAGKGSGDHYYDLNLTVIQEVISNGTAG